MPNWTIAAVSLFFASGLLILPAGAWFVQPPYAAPEADAEIKMLTEASATMFDAFAALNAEFARAERSHEPLSREGLVQIRTQIEQSAGLYREAATSNLAALPIGLGAMREISQILADDFSVTPASFAQRFPVVENRAIIVNAAEFSEALAIVASDIVTTLNILIEFSSFGPDDPLNTQARTAVSTLAHQMSFFLRFGSAGSVGIGVSQGK